MVSWSSSGTRFEMADQEEEGKVGVLMDQGAQLVSKGELVSQREKK